MTESMILCQERDYLGTINLEALGSARRTIRFQAKKSGELAGENEVDCWKSCSLVR